MAAVGTRDGCEILRDFDRLYAQGLLKRLKDGRYTRRRSDDRRRHMSMREKPKAKPPTVIDPDNVPETICNGQCNFAVFGDLATLTFTHVRPDATALLQDGTRDLRAIVRARIVLTKRSAVALRDLLNRVMPQPALRVPNSTKH
jgi:hypothetical protein